MYKKYLKQVIDFSVALFGLIILSPIFLIVMFILFLSNQGKPFFLQSRPGKNEKIFKIIKFKTMNDKKDKDGNLLPMKYRITPVGAFIRKTSLDELPQLFNVLKGDMSLVGPRPLLESYLPMYTLEQRRRHSLKPGITGWAQVNGRNTVTWKDKFKLDVWYVDNISFSLDVMIIMKTVKKVFIRENVADVEPAVTPADFE